MKFLDSKFEQLTDLGVLDMASAIARDHHVTLDSVFSPNRHKNISHARQEIMYRFRETLGWSYPELGALLNRDHTTCLHGVRAHAERYGLPLDPRVRVRVDIHAMRQLELFSAEAAVA